MFCLKNRKAEKSDIILIELATNGQINIVRYHYYTNSIILTTISMKSLPSNHIKVKGALISKQGV